MTDKTEQGHITIRGIVVDQVPKITYGPKLTVLQENIEIIYGSDLNEKEMREYDYLETEERPGSQFFRYKDDVFWLGNFLITQPKPQAGDLLEGWHGLCGTGFFHAYVVKLSEDGETVTLGQVTS